MSTYKGRTSASTYKQKTPQYVKFVESQGLMPRLVICKCGKQTAMFLDSEIGKGNIYIQEQPCTECGHYMSTLKHVPFEEFLNQSKLDSRSKYNKAQ
jgi:hypothetical protein